MTPDDAGHGVSGAWTPVSSVRLIVGAQTRGRSNQTAKHGLAARSALGNVAITAFIFYDTETTGLETAFDQILQFAAIKTDDDLNELDPFDIRCRLMPHIVPSLGALRVREASLEQFDD